MTMRHPSKSEWIPESISLAQRRRSAPVVEGSERTHSSQSQEEAPEMNRLAGHDVEFGAAQAWHQGVHAQCSVPFQVTVWLSACLKLCAVAA